MQIFGRSALNRVLTAVREYTQKFRTSSSFVGAAARGRRSYSFGAAVGAGVLGTGVFTDVFTDVFSKIS